VLVGVGNPPVVFFLERIRLFIRIRVTPQPELLDKLFALFVRRELKKRFPLVGRNDVKDILTKPCLICLAKLGECLLGTLLLFLLGKLGLRRGCTPLLLRKYRRIEDNGLEKKNDTKTGPFSHGDTSTSGTPGFYPPGDDASTAECPYTPKTCPSGQY